MMDLVGIPCGPVRLPLRMLEPEEVVQLDKELEELGAMDWLKA
jgi:dihydrodipicolinate synthase/N-acetylneuraminate lyase